MSEMPNGWVETTLGELSVWGSGGTPSRANPAYFGGAIPWVTISDLSDGIVSSTFASITDIGLQNSAAKLAPVGSILVALYGSIGKLGIAGMPLTTNQAIAYSVPNESAFDSKFLFHYLHCERGNLLALGSGVTQKNIYLGDVKAYKCPLAPRAEQTRIVAKLEELLSDLDAGVAELKAAQKKLAQYSQSLLKAAVEGALTAQWRTQHQPTETGAQLLERILSERRARWEAKQLAKFKEQGKAPPKDWQTKYSKPVQPDITDLPVLPGGWVWASGEQLCEFITKGTTPPKELDAGKDKSIPFLRVTNLTDKGVLDLADKVFVSEETHQGFLARSAVYPNDVLMNIVGPPLGQVAVIPNTFDEWNINQAIAIFRAVDGVSPGYVCLYLLSPVAQQWLKARSKTTAGQTNLTLEVCRGLPFPLPPQEEQQAMVLTLAETTDATTRQIDAVEVSLKQSTAQRQNILRAAFSGQLAPQDPNDEPASVLLERIRAERDARDAVKKPRGRQSKESI